MFDAITVMPARALEARGGFGGRGRAGRGPFRRVRGGAARRRRAATGTAAPTLDDRALESLAGIADVKDVYPNCESRSRSNTNSSRVLVGVGIPMSSRDEGRVRDAAYGAFSPATPTRRGLLSLDLASDQ